MPSRAGNTGVFSEEINLLKNNTHSGIGYKGISFNFMVIVNSTLNDTCHLPMAWLMYSSFICKYTIIFTMKCYNPSQAYNNGSI